MSQDNGLRMIEEMLHEIGAAGPSTSGPAGSQQQHSKTVSRATAVMASQQQSKDCLAVESRAQFATPKFSQRASSETPSMAKGVSMAGKDSSRKRFYGKGFQPPPAESPGPIYEPLGFTDESSQGRSFSRAERLRDNVSSASAASYNPQMHSMPASVGRQTESRMSNAPNAVFSKAERSIPGMMISKVHNKSMSSVDSPSPDYPQDIFRMNGSGDGIKVSLSGSRNVPMSKLFISKAHVVDSIGAASPGPMYDPEQSRILAEASNRKFRDSRRKPGHKRGPDCTFGMSDRISDRQLDTEEPTVFSADATCVVDTSGDKPVRRCMNQITKSGTGVRHTPMQKFISHAHSKIQCTSETPGPAYYSANVEPTKSNRPGQSFTTEAKEGLNGRFYGKELSNSKGRDSPGNRYQVNYDSVRKSGSSAVMGGKNASQTEPPNRFNQNMFLGKGMGQKYGADSPGPAYSQEYNKSQGPAFTMVHKERHFDHVNPAPSRPRWVSPECAKENRGAFSPGPKYHTGNKEFGVNGPSYSFGISDREFSTEQQDKFDAAEKPYTSPGDARFISNTHSKTARAGKSSPGPQNPNVSPKYDLLEKSAPSVSINGARGSSKSRIPRPQDGPVLQLEIKDSVCNPDIRTHAFSKAEKMPPAKATAGPGPTHYRPKHKLMEGRVAGSSFGGLGFESHDDGYTENPLATRKAQNARKAKAEAAAEARK